MRVFRRSIPGRGKMIVNFKRLSFPESLVEEVRLRGEHSTPSGWSGKGLERPAGPRGDAQVGAPGGGHCTCCLQELQPQSVIPAAQAPDPRAPRTQPRILQSPWDRQRREGPRTARTLLQQGASKLCRSASPTPGASRPLQTGRLRWFLQELTPELESWPPPVGLFLPVSPCAWDRAGPREQGPHRVNSSH